MAKKEVSPQEQEWLAIRDWLVEMLRDPAVLGPVRRFCKLLWREVRHPENQRMRHIFLSVIASGTFPENFLESEKKEAEARAAKRWERRARRLTAA